MVRNTYDQRRLRSRSLSRRAQLYWAAIRGDSHAVTRLAAEGADVNWRAPTRVAREPRGRTVSYAFARFRLL